MASVTLSSVSKFWGSFVAVEKISLAMADGEFIVLLGPSGCGKSTTMRMIAGLDDPSAGEIRIDDRVVNDLPPGKRDLAMVFQNYGLYPHMTVADNIGYPLKVAGVNREERERQVRAAAERVELGGLLERKPGQLSGGQRQRVALGRAIVRTPKLFLMDEPLSNLDAKLRVYMRAELKHLQRDLGTTTIYVTHDQVEAMTLADRVAVMANGKLQQVGTPLDIYNTPANVFVAGFLGNPPMNLLPIAIADGRVQDSELTLAAPAGVNGAITVGQRPEDMRLSETDAGNMAGEVYTTELLGDSTLVTVKVGKNLVAVKTDKNTKVHMGENVGIRFDPKHLHFFDTTSGTRVAFDASR
ncbi:MULTISPECIES: ABC transporter ATP-binding protein [unclassified Mesorhizobium]|uniref:ABC transporter ATP-binding protein n=1 Tax=unclassified Mesorhizobium TaxID=325217 RepID=UPI0004CFCC7A|nr:ABC transporter ATP-binding protein [Mesorhizobium sp. LSHC420B00]